MEQEIEKKKITKKQLSIVDSGCRYILLSSVSVKFHYNFLLSIGYPF